MWYNCNNNTYEVLFDDGYVKALKVHRMSKYSRPKQSSSLFDPVQGTKAERREKKRRLNVAELFGKKTRLDDEKPFRREIEEKPGKQPLTNTTTVVEKPLEDNVETWYPQWENGKPIGKESFFNASDGKRKSVMVQDPRLPKGWVKHLAQRINGASAGKWETFIINPESRRFRSKSEIINYLRDNNITKYDIGMFDFSLHRYRTSVKKREVVAPAVIPPQIESKLEIMPKKEEQENKNLLKIPIVNNAYQCPIEGCGKSYRKENLAQMHVKHYHPEYTKFLDFTPNVADLAYARTVGESLDKSPDKKPVLKPVPSKTDTKPSTDIETKTPLALPSKSKDSEIIKLLGSKPNEGRKDLDHVKPLSAALSPKQYPDIKLKDLLRSNNHHDDDLSLRPIAKTPSGIKTLLPVTRPESTIYEPESQHKFDDAVARAKLNLKRKRAGEPVARASFSPVEQPEVRNNIIIEGGQVIKIVRMKQEEIINCTCRYTEEDGLMIQCDLCLCWQHAFCNNIERESQVPDKYVCWICQNPLRQRTSKKYFHDQDWLKHGVLATASFHTKDQELLTKRFQKLKKSHDISGGLLELADYVHNLKVKLKIAEAKNHPKLYLWSKAWEKPLSSMENVSENLSQDIIENGKKNNNNEIHADHGESMLMAYLKKGDSGQANLPLPIVPQPEAPIESGVCRLNLLGHISHSQNLVEERLDEFEKLIDGLEDDLSVEESETYPRTRQTLNLIVKDLETLQEFSQLSAL